MITLHLSSPMCPTQFSHLTKGDCVLISGTIYTARDAAHKKIADHFAQTGEMLLSGQTIYYAGPCPKKTGEIIGSIGPTTSYRMDNFAPQFLENGCLVTIGKGNRSRFATDAIQKFGGIHFDAIGGAGAYYKNCVKVAKVVLFPELGAEAVFQLEVVDFPVIVSII